MEWKLDEIARLLHAPLPPGLAPLSATGYAIDSRAVRPGDLYFAIRGHRLDGHDFVPAALAAGALAAVVSRPAAAPGRELCVADPLVALQALAHSTRRLWGGRLLAVTGSAGKTTTKDMIAAILQPSMRVLKSEGNLNNHFGLPLSLLRLQPDHELAVVEMGMNHAGEIARLSEIAAPDIGVFTNVGTAHLGNFASVEGIAAAKRELAESLPPSGAMVLNAADPRVARFGQGFAGALVYYRGEDFTGPLRYLGEHNRANAAAAVAAASLFGVDAGAAARALAQLEPPPGRGRLLRRGGLTLLDDCYNANPEAMEQMLRVLAATPASRRIAVLGEMRELGAASETLHQRVGAAAAAAGLDALLAVGPAAAPILAAATAAGFAGLAAFAPDPAAAAARLLAFVRPGDVILFKASRGVGLEAALQFVLAHAAALAQDTN